MVGMRPTMVSGLGIRRFFFFRVFLRRKTCDDNKSNRIWNRALWVGVIRSFAASVASIQSLLQLGPLKWETPTPPDCRYFASVSAPGH